ncbi:CLUMA_CG000125, isoform A [Clunio marinus]|uniref:CLUMA_CG000125, isoform A n=1 Tax=Clunio marinus TaxID=568069 RepID=A0A1J1HF73_9DIPT|nr:CLUMA_CG000125, isoform A [Clunio marinus]
MESNQTTGSIESSDSQRVSTGPQEHMDDEEIENEPTLTLDQSTLQIIPSHLRKLLIQLKGATPTQYNVMNCLVVALALETGFIGDWCYCDDVLKNYALNWSYSFDRRLILDVANLPIDFSNNNTSKILKFKFSISPNNEIVVLSVDSGDLLILSAYLNDNRTLKSTSCLALPVSRYVIKAINLNNLPSIFRNLKELSIMLKNNLFLPLRNKIYSELTLKFPNPSLVGTSEFILPIIIRYLNKKDLVALGSTCKTIHNVISFYKSNKKET